MSNVIEDVWHVSEEAYPAEGTVEERLRFLLQYAVLAPSGHNMQPWAFVLKGDHLELWADKDRALPVLDPENRELIMSCGAALFHLRAALVYFGNVGTITLFPDYCKPDLVARVELGKEITATAEERRIFHAIPDRRTNRLPFEARPIPEDLMNALFEAADEEGAQLTFVTRPAMRGAVADLIAEGSLMQFADPRFRREIAAWLRPSGAAAAEGISGFAYEMGDVLSYQGSYATAFDAGKIVEEKNRRLALEAPALAVLGTEGDIAPDWLRAGQALDRVLLRARVDGVWASFLNQPVQVASLRPHLRHAVGNGIPQVILRLGYGPYIGHTPRRPVEDVLRPAAS